VRDVTKACSSRRGADGGTAGTRRRLSLSPSTLAHNPARCSRPCTVRQPCNDLQFSACRSFSLAAQIWCIAPAGAPTPKIKGPTRFVLRPIMLLHAIICIMAVALQYPTGAMRDNRYVMRGEAPRSRRELGLSCRHLLASGRDNRDERRYRHPLLSSRSLIDRDGTAARGSCLPLMEGPCADG
jgi:hypothetical protein